LTDSLPFVKVQRSASASFLAGRQQMITYPRLLLTF